MAAGQRIGRAYALAARALVASCLGHDKAAREDAGEALALAERGAIFATMTATWALGLLELSLDNPAETHRCLGPIVERVDAAGIGEPGSIRLVSDEIEALLALGELDQAGALLERFEAPRSAAETAFGARGSAPVPRPARAREGSRDTALVELEKAVTELSRDFRCPSSGPGPFSRWAPQSDARIAAATLARR